MNLNLNITLIRTYRFLKIKWRDEVKPECKVIFSVKEFCERIRYFEKVILGPVLPVPDNISDSYLAYKYNPI